MTAAAKAPAKKAAPKKTASAKVTKNAKVSKPKSSTKPKSSHPPFKQMVKKAVGELNEKSGSSRQAILKYVCANYKVDAKSGNKYVKLALASAVKSGVLKRVGAKGIGANGSFRLASDTQPKAKKVVKPKKVKTQAKPKKVSAKKVTKVPKVVKRLAPKSPKKVVSKKPKAAKAKKA